ncbi:unannotated protein [freshwater metagenome]|uniref:Unannotated protein n=1 Tax=freshwater metagenome TaxID=449393 RepID=A0A6J7IYL1_9ZZZZ
MGASHRRGASQRRGRGRVSRRRARTRGLGARPHHSRSRRADLGARLSTRRLRPPRCARLLPRRRLRDVQHRHARHLVSPALQPRPLCSGVGRLPARTGAPLSRRARRRDRGDAMGAGQCGRGERRPLPRRGRWRQRGGELRGGRRDREPRRLTPTRPAVAAASVSGHRSSRRLRVARRERRGLSAQHRDAAVVRSPLHTCDRRPRGLAAVADVRHDARRARAGSRGDRRVRSAA